MSELSRAERSPSIAKTCFWHDDRFIDGKRASKVDSCETFDREALKEKKKNNQSHRIDVYHLQLSNRI